MLDLRRLIAGAAAAATIVATVPAAIGSQAWAAETTLSTADAAVTEDALDLKLRAIGLVEGMRYG